ncbi:hypothetical protein SEA_TANDEM_49 [Microbacterium phage Tandem]|nr:hypothetical protein SEA_TANDEM_49 [Microbacterium phage Tandem]QAU07382.1 hypothetical protein SEA_ALLEB_50 [Microbacterium phage Alleb]
MGLYENVERMWFGTEQRMGWIETPQTGADVSSLGQSANAVLQNGGGTVRNSWDSHKVYQFSWGTGATPSMVSLLQAYRNGSYGRGLLYFHDPMFYATNLLPKRWADPSMAVNFEAEPLVPDANPTAVPVVSTANNYPVSAASYSLPANYSSQNNGTEHFIPIPEGMTLLLGAAYDGPGEVYARTPAGVTVIPSLSPAASTVVSVQISGQPWVRLGLRNTAAGTRSIAITGMTARLSSAPVAGGANFVNRFINPSFEAAGSAVEVRRNLVANPTPVDATGYQTSGPNTFSGGAITSTAPGPTTTYIFSSPSTVPIVTGRIYLLRAQVMGDSGTAVTSLFPRPHKRTGNTYYTPDGGHITVPSNGAWQDVAMFWTATVDIPVGESFDLAVISNGGTAPTGYKMSMRNVLIEDMGTTRPSVAPPFFSVLTGSPDPDMTAAWTGTANNSPTVLNGVSVPNVVASRAVAIRSSHWAQEGSYSMRVIPTNETVNAAISVGGLPTTATHIVTSYLSSPFTGTGGSALWGSVRRSQAGGVVESLRPNVSGTYTHRILTDSATSNLELWGGRKWQGDIWFDLLTVVDGSYDGIQFSGNTSGASWNGAANASTSTYAMPLQGDVAAGPWFSGEGHSGCRFQGNPTVINYNGVNGGQIGLSAILQEVGAWE